MRGVDHQQSQSHWADDAIRSELELQMILSDKCRNRIIKGRPLGVGCHRSHDHLQKGAPW